MRVLPAKNTKKIEELKTAFSKTFNNIDNSKNRYQIFQDMVMCMAIAYQNHAMYGGLAFNQKLEDEFLAIKKTYSVADFHSISQTLHHNIIDQLEAYGAPHDVLGDLYMSLDFGSKHMGQHFTPIEISNLMAGMISDDVSQTIKSNGYLSISDPACGAGSTLLAKVTKLIEAGYNPANSMYVEGVAIDRLSAMMCFVQMTLWNVPARIFVGDSLSLKMREVWKTSAYWRGLWSMRLGH